MEHYTAIPVAILALSALTVIVYAVVGAWAQAKQDDTVRSYHWDR